MTHKDASSGDVEHADAQRHPIPQFELDSYDNIEFSMPAPFVSEALIDAKIAELADKLGPCYVDTKRKIVGPQDNVYLKISVDNNGVEVTALNSDDRLYTVGEGLMPIDFDRNILGMSVGQSREFDFKAPKLPGDDQAEETFHATVTINKIVKKTTPEVDDEWVSQHLPAYNSAEQLRKHVAQELLDQADQRATQEKNARAVQELAKRFHGHIDDFYYEQARANMMASYEQQARSVGMDLADWVVKQGMDQNQFSMMLMIQVKDMLQQGLSLDAWARHFGLEADEDDVRELAELMSAQGHASQFLAALDKDKDQRDAFRLAARRYVANRDLVEKATIHYEDDAHHVDVDLTFDQLHTIGSCTHKITMRQVAQLAFAEGELATKDLSETGKTQGICARGKEP